MDGPDEKRLKPRGGREFRSHSRKSSSNAQTTAIDSAVGMVNLPTILAHASGEWIASDWPVCPVAETANPHRMGAALTYARRYDLDAPEICAPAPAMGPLGSARTAGSAEAASTDRPATGRGIDGSAGGLQLPARSHGNGRARGTAKPASPPVLSADKSATLRDRLLREIAALPSEDSTTDWAQRALVAKNQLTASDARLLEVAQTATVRALCVRTLRVVRGSGSQGPSSFAGDDTIGTNPGPDDVGNDQPARVDKSTLAVSAPPPLSRQSAPSLYRPTSLPPLWPQAIRPPSPRHLQPRALGRKASDEFAVPLCRIHHRLVHRVGNEAAWWKDASSCPGSSGTTAAWIRGGSRPGRRRNVPADRTA
jgi:hypothetical protein